MHWWFHASHSYLLQFVMVWIFFFFFCWVIIVLMIKFCKLGWDSAMDLALILKVFFIFYDYMGFNCKPSKCNCCVWTFYGSWFPIWISWNVYIFLLKSYCCQVVTFSLNSIKSCNKLNCSDGLLTLNREVVVLWEIRLSLFFFFYLFCLCGIIFVYGNFTHTHCGMGMNRRHQSINFFTSSKLCQHLIIIIDGGKLLAT